MHSTLKRTIFAMGVPTLLCLWMPIAALSADAAPLNKVGTAAVTVTEGTVAAKIVELTDGDVKTRWIMRTGVPQTRLVFDMTAPRTVGKIRVANYPGANATRGIKDVDVFVGDAPAPAADGTPAVAKTQIAISTEAVVWTEIALPKPVKGRYVTLRIISNWGAPAYAANEVEIYTQEADPAVPAAQPTTTPHDTPATTTPTTTTGTTPTTGTTNPPAEKKPTSPIVAVTEYDKADAVVTAAIKALTDGDATTRWNGIPQGKKAEDIVPILLQLDLGTSQTVKQLRIANYSSPSKKNNERGIKTIDVFIGDAAAPAKDEKPAVAASVIAISDDKGTVWTTIDLPKPITGRYINIRIKDNWGGNNYAANEIEVNLVPATVVK
ncbi:MAG: discoidin domain-containing protein [bacterium]